MSPFKPLSAGSYIPTPKKIGYRKGIQNIQNKSDHKCIMWVMAAALRASLGIKVHDPQKLTKELKELAEKILTWRE
mgnify:CR=1 FL=1